MIYRQVNIIILWLIPMQVMAGHSHFLFQFYTFFYVFNIENGVAWQHARLWQKYCTMNGILIILIIV